MIGSRMNLIHQLKKILSYMLSPAALMAGAYLNVCLATAVLWHLPEPRNPLIKPSPVVAPVRGQWDDADVNECWFDDCDEYFI